MKPRGPKQDPNGANASDSNAGAHSPPNHSKFAHIMRSGALTDDTFLSDRFKRALEELQGYIHKGSVEEAGPAIHVLEYARFKIAEALLKELLRTGAADALLQEAPEGAIRRTAFKILLHASPDSLYRDMPDAYGSDLVRGELSLYPARAGDIEEDMRGMLLSLKPPESGSWNAYNRHLSEPPGPEKLASSPFSSVLVMQGQMRYLRGSSDVRERALTSLIDSISAHMSTRNEKWRALMDLIYLGVEMGPDGKPASSRAPRPFSEAEHEQAMAEVDRRHYAASSYKALSKTLVPKQEGLVPLIWRILTTPLGQGSRKEVTSLSKGEMDKLEEAEERAMREYTGQNWPIKPKEAEFLVRRIISPQLDANPELQQSIEHLFKRYVSTELRNLSRNFLLYSSDDRIALLWCDVDRMALRLGKAKDAEGSLQLADSLKKFTELLTAIGRTSRALDSSLRELRLSAQALGSGGGNADTYADALLHLSTTARCRSDLLGQLRDAYIQLRELRKLDRARLLGGFASTRDTIRRFFHETSECNFKDEIELLKKFEAAFGTPSPDAETAEQLSQALGRIRRYREHLEELQRNPASSKALEGSQLGRLKDSMRGNEDLFRLYERAKASLPPLLAEILDYYDKRESTHSLYTYGMSKPYYARSMWLTPENIAECLLLLINIDKQRDNSAIHIGGRPLLSYEAEVNEHFKALINANGRILDALAEYEAATGECPPLEKARLLFSYYDKKNVRLRDEYASKLHYGPSNEAQMHVTADIREDAEGLTVRVHSAVVTPGFTMNNILQEPLEIRINRADALSTFNPETYAKKSHAAAGQTPEESRFGQKIEADSSFAKHMSKLKAGIGPRAKSVYLLEKTPASMALADVVRRDYARNGAIVAEGDPVVLHVKRPLVLGREDDIAVFAEGVFHGRKELKRAGGDLDRTYHENARGAATSAMSAALFGELNDWLMGELNRMNAGNR